MPNIPSQKFVPLFNTNVACKLSEMHISDGWPFNLMQLKIIQECISLTVFTLICAFVFKSQPIQWNHICAFGCIIAAVFFCFLK